MNGVGLGRRSFLSAASMLAVTGMAMAAARAQEKVAPAKVVIALASKASLQYLPLLLADRLGYFHAEGVEVEFREYGSGPKALLAVREGLGDVVGGSYEQTIAMQGVSQYFRAFVLLARAPQVALGVSNKTLPRFRSIADLKGRRVGVAASGASGDMLLRLVLMHAGLAYDDVNVVELPNVGVALTAVRSGEVDAISHTEPLMTLLEHRADVRIVSDTRTLKGTQEVFGGPMPSACLFATDGFVQKNSKAIQALTNAVIHALKWLQTAGPSDLIKVVPESFMLGDRGVYLAAFNKVRETIAIDGLIADEGVRSVMRVQARLNSDIKVEQISLARTFTNTFSQRAKEKYLA